MGLLIEDGYTLDGTIPAQGKQPEINFRYRPALYAEVKEWTNSVRTTGKLHEAATVKLLVKHVASWDVTIKAGSLRKIMGKDAEPVVADHEDDDVVLVPIHAKTLARVPQPVLDQLVNFVTGYAPEDQGDDAKNSATGSGSSSSTQPSPTAAASPA